MQFLENDDFHRRVRRAPVLCLVFEHQVEDVWLEALEANDDDRQDVLRFKDYVTKNLGWMASDELVPFWQPWTTNNKHSWKVAPLINDRMCRRPHLNVYIFIQFLQKKQTGNEVKMIQLAAGGVVRPTERKYRQLD